MDLSSPPCDVANDSTPSSQFETFFSLLPSAQAHHDVYSAFTTIRDSIPPSPTSPYTPTQLAYIWLSDHFSQSPFVDLGMGNDSLPTGSIFLYKKVANKTRPVVMTLLENFRIQRHEHPSPLENLLPLPT